MGRSPCCAKEHTNKGAWTKEEDERLVNYIKSHGECCWRSLPKSAGLQRCGKSCRLRWINYLRPDFKRGNFSEEEDDVIINLHSLLGNKWSLIDARLPGRTDNEVKNYWNTHIKRKLLTRGIDPQTHRPSLEAPRDGGFQLINVQGSLLQFTPETINPNKNVSNTADEGVNLELSISLPSLPPAGSLKQPQHSYARQLPMLHQGLCLCCHLGFNNSKSSSCNSVSMTTTITYGR